MAPGADNEWPDHGLSKCETGVHGGEPRQMVGAEITDRPPVLVVRIRRQAIFEIRNGAPCQLAWLFDTTSLQRSQE